MWLVYSVLLYFLPYLLACTNSSFPQKRVCVKWVREIAVVMRGKSKEKVKMLEVDICLLRVLILMSLALLHF